SRCHFISSLFPYTTLFRSQGGFERVGDQFQRAVAGDVAVTVVDSFEVVDVDKQHREGLARALPARPFEFGGLQHGAAVEQSRQQDRKSTRLNSSHQIISYA